jgi:glycosyltransferase involved in cell wall biosynthesis
MAVPDQTDRPTVSVALCTHNGERFIGEQVRSILRQTELPTQIVLSDDASSDTTVSLVQREVNEHGGAPIALVVLRNDPALGVTANFAQAVAACTGDLVALSDQDDVWLPDRVETMVDSFAAAASLTLLFSDAQLVNAAGEPLPDTLFDSIRFTAAEQREVHAGEALTTLLRRNVVTGATVMFRRELLDSALPFPASWVHDEWLAMIAAITGRVDYLPLQLIEYRQHGGNQIGARKPTLRDKIGRVTESRTARNARLFARAQALVDRGGFAPEIATLVAAKAAHEQRRQRYPAARLLRIGPVLRTALSGGYARYGRGRYDVVRDLLQPDA